MKKLLIFGIVLMFVLSSAVIYMVWFDSDLQIKTFEQSAIYRGESLPEFTLDQPNHTKFNYFKVYPNESDTHCSDGNCYITEELCNLNQLIEKDFTSYILDVNKEIDKSHLVKSSSFSYLSDIEYQEAERTIWNKNHTERIGKEMFNRSKEIYTPINQADLLNLASVGCVKYRRYVEIPKYKEGFEEFEIVVGLGQWTYPEWLKFDNVIFYDIFNRTNNTDASTNGWTDELESAWDTDTESLLKLPSGANRGKLTRSDTDAETYTYLCTQFNFSSNDATYENGLMPLVQKTLDLTYETLFDAGTSNIQVWNDSGYINCETNTFPRDGDWLCRNMTNGDVILWNSTLETTRLLCRNDDPRDDNQLEDQIQYYSGTGDSSSRINAVCLADLISDCTDFEAPPILNNEPIVLEHYINTSTNNVDNLTSDNIWDYGKVEDNESTSLAITYNTYNETTLYSSGSLNITNGTLTQISLLHNNITTKHENWTLELFVNDSEFISVGDNDTITILDSPLNITSIISPSTNITTEFVNNKFNLSVKDADLEDGHNITCEVYINSTLNTTQQSNSLSGADRTCGFYAINLTKGNYNISLRTQEGNNIEDMDWLLIIINTPPALLEHYMVTNESNNYTDAELSAYMKVEDNESDLNFNERWFNDTVLYYENLNNPITNNTLTETANNVSRTYTKKWENWTHEITFWDETNDAIQHNTTITQIQDYPLTISSISDTSTANTTQEGELIKFNLTLFDLDFADNWTLNCSNYLDGIENTSIQSSSTSGNIGYCGFAVENLPEGTYNITLVAVEYLTVDMSWSLIVNHTNNVPIILEHYITSDNVNNYTYVNFTPNLKVEDNESNSTIYYETWYNGSVEFSTSSNNITNDTLTTLTELNYNITTKHENWTHEIYISDGVNQSVRDNKTFTVLDYPISLDSISDDTQENTTTEQATNKFNLTTTDYDFNNGYSINCEAYINSTLNSSIISSSTSGDNGYCGLATQTLSEGNYNISLRATEGEISVDMDWLLTVEKTILNTSLFSVKLNVSDFNFASDTYITDLTLKFNVSETTADFFLMKTMNIEKLTGAGINEVWIRFSIDDVIQFEELLRTVDKQGADLDTGSAMVSPFKFNANQGQHNATFEFKRTGTGIVRIKNIDTNFVAFRSTNNISVRHNVTTAEINFGSTTFERVFNFTVDKVVNSSTFFALKKTVNASAVTIVDQFCANEDNDDSGSFIRRRLSDASDIGSMGDIHIEIDESMTHAHSIEARSSTGAIVTENLTIVSFDMRDNDSNFINHFFESNPRTNLSNVMTVGAGITEIINDTITIFNGTNFLLTAIASFNSTTGLQTPSFFVNTTNLTEVKCKSVKERVLSDGDDYGEIIIFTLCEDLVVGNNYQFSLWANVSAGEEIIILDEAISGFETTPRDVVQILSTAPIVAILNPLDNDNISGIIQINASVTEQQGDSFISNITINNGTDVTILATNMDRFNLTHDWDTTLLADGFYNLTWTSTENETLNNLTGFDTIEVSIDNNAPILNIVYPINNTWYVNDILDVNWTVSDLNLDSCWYSWDLGTLNTTINCFNNLSTIRSDGSHEIIVWANDTSNRINFSRVNFSIDGTAPVVSGITETDITLNSAKINWQTNESANYSIQYNGLTDNNATISDSPFSHDLTGLTHSTTYDYNITACDVFGNCDISSNEDFTTLIPTPPNIDQLYITPDDQDNVTNVSFDIYLEASSYYNSTLNYYLNVSNGTVDYVWQESTISNVTLTNIYTLDDSVTKKNEVWSFCTIVGDVYKNSSESCVSVTILDSPIVLEDTYSTVEPTNETDNSSTDKFEIIYMDLDIDDGYSVDCNSYIDGVLETSTNYSNSTTSISTSADWLVTNETHFDEGVYNNTIYNVDGVQLSAGNMIGNYTSKIFDSNNSGTSWDNISWDGLFGTTNLSCGDGLDSTHLVGLWCFDENTGSNAEDSSVSGNNGTLQNMEEADWVDGQINSALIFDGNNEFVNIDNVLGFDRTDNFTLEGWAKTSSATTQELIGKRVVGGNARGWEMYVNADGTLQVNMVSDGAGGDLLQIKGSTVTNDGNWFYFVMVYNGTSEAKGVKIYVNSVEENYTIINDNLLNTIVNAVDLNIGSRAIGSLAFNGNLDEIAIYNETITQAQITSNYARGNTTLLQLDLNLSVKSCNDASCDGESWINLSGESPLSLPVSDNRYFRYKFDFQTSNGGSPKLYNTNVSYSTSVGVDDKYCGVITSNLSVGSHNITIIAEEEDSIKYTWIINVLEIFIPPTLLCNFDREPYIDDYLLINEKLTWTCNLNTTDNYSCWTLIEDYNTGEVIQINPKQEESRTLGILRKTFNSINGLVNVYFTDHNIEAGGKYTAKANCIKRP